MPVSYQPEEDHAFELLASCCDLLVSRIFAEAQFRVHHKILLERMPEVIKQAEQGIQIITRAHFMVQQPSKFASSQTEGDCGSRCLRQCLPDEIGPGKPSLPMHYQTRLRGRTTCTVISEVEACWQAVAEIPAISMIAEEYIRPIYGYITRVEVIGGECRLILKRSVTAGGWPITWVLPTTIQTVPKSSRQTAVRAMEILDIELEALILLKQGTYIS